MASVRHATIWAYPWDLADEGVGRALGKMQDAGLHGVSLASSYHAGKFLLPHNPRRHLYFPEDGAVYFRPRLRYGKIKPRVSKLAPVWQQVRRETRKRGMTLTAWTVCFHNSWLGEKNPDACVVNAFGDRLLHTLCPANARARQYVTTMVRDLARNEPDTIELESCDFMGFDHGFHHEKTLIPLGPYARLLLGLCFCDECGTAGLRRIVSRTLETALRGEADEPADAKAEFEALAGVYQENRVRAIRTLVEEIRDAVSCEVRFILEADEWRTGVDPRKIPAHSFTVMAYTKDPEEARRMVAPYEGLPLVAGVRACLPVENASQLKAVVDAVACERVSFYNYGLMHEHALGWIRECLTA